jgi:hypothetical protein
LEVINKLIPLDSSAMICNAEGIILKFIPAETFDMRVKEGTQVAKGGSLEAVLRTGNEVRKTIPREAYGVPVKGVGIPIYEDGNLVGGIAIGISLANQQTLMDTAQLIATTSQQITATTEEVAATAASLAGDITKIKQGSAAVTNHIKKTDDILKFVSDVAASSNILGLNAAIEAARAGEQGRGFAVVADEIRKMADNCANAVNDIRNILNSIQKETSEMAQTISDTAHVAERQATATEQISASMQQLASSASEIEKVAQII